MNVFFDMSVCQPNRESKFHGGGVYGYIVLSHLIKMIPQNLIVYYDKNSFVDPSIEELIDNCCIKTIDKNEKSLLQCVKEEQTSVFYSPLFSKSYKHLIDIGIPIVITIHGLRNLEMNRDKTEILYARNFIGKTKALLKQTPYYNWLTKNYWKEKKWLFENDHVNIITVSNHSKHSIINYYPTVKENKIKVLYSVSTTPDDYQSTKPYVSDKYYLIVSANRWLKNAYRAIEAFDRLFDNSQFGIEGEVIVLGLSKSSAIYKRIRNKQRFQLMGYVDKSTLESLYKGAYALVYPSLNEGFGYPPLEAMKYGTPVISSPFASVTEICRDSVLYANPYSCEEIANRILQLEEQSIYEQYKNLGLFRYKQVEEKQISDLNSLCQYITSFLNCR